MNYDNPYTPPASNVSTADIPEKSKVEGLGGWLVLVGLGVVVSPLRIIAQVFPTYAKLISDGSWTALTTPGSAAYSPLWMPILVTEIVVNLALVLAWVFVAFQFFGKRARFPKLYISMLAATITFQLFDAWAITLVSSNAEVFDAETTKELGRSIFVALIWIPYMLISKRVKATFVR
jgi:hypothetical protein